MIKSERYDGKTVTLVYKETKKPVNVGDVLDSGTDKYIIEGGRAPHKSSSAGKLWVKAVGSESKYSSELYTHCFEVEWTE